MRSALAQIKEELGADAVIMSNKRIPEGVELMAAVDNNVQVNADKLANDSTTINPEQNNNATSGATRAIESDIVTIGKAASTSNKNNTAPSDSLSALLNRQVQQTSVGQGVNQAKHDKIAAAAEKLNPSSNQQVAEKKTPSASSDIEQQFKNFTDRLEQGGSGQKSEGSQPQQTSQDQNEQPSVAHTSKASQQSHKTSQQTHNAEFEQMKNEMSSIRELLEHQVSGLMWQDMAQKDPSRAMLVNRLMSLGMSEQVSDQIAGYIPAQKNDQDTWQLAKKFISQQINTTNNDIIHRGGVVSLVGPTGVGKTTTIAKLAARFAQIHGADQVVMISTDNYRIAGFEQLATYGRIIGCQVKLASDAQSLDVLLQQFSKKKLILIDTAGMGQRDMRLAKHLTTLVSNARVRIRNYLVLAANTQQRVMQENVERFKKVPLAGCIYTKLDESLSIGEIISTSIQNGLAIGYLTDGQRVPEDIKVANAEKLVTLADKMATKTQINNPITWRTAPTSANAVVY